MREAGSQWKAITRSSMDLPQTIPTAAATTAALPGVGLSTVELDSLLLSRGWVAVDRDAGCTVYDWPPSAPCLEHEVTYLIVDSTDECGLPPYRVRLLDGERFVYDVASELASDLDMIEGRRCAACMRNGSY